MTSVNIIAVSMIAVLGVVSLLMLGPSSGMATACTFSIDSLDLDTFQYYLDQSDSMPSPQNSIFEMHVKDHINIMNELSSVPNLDTYPYLAYLNDEMITMQSYGFTDETSYAYVTFLESLIYRIKAC